MSLFRNAAWVMLVSLTVWPCTGGEAPSATPDSRFEIVGKIVMVRMRRGAPCGHFTEGYLEEAEIRRFGDCAFVAGKMRQAPDVASKSPEGGVTIWLPLADVAEMAEFKDWGAVEKSLAVAASTTIEPTVDFGHAPFITPHVKSVFTSSRKFRVPFRLADESGVAKLILFRSQDEGKTWRLVSERVAGDTTFTVSVGEDGPNWFAVQAIAEDGKQWPADSKGLQPILKVTVASDRNGASVR